ncbi:MAG: MMPL family transporter [Nitrososphaerales archaeon]|nr:MMPL family transporter [Nitrososphaerales archaeon]
MSSSPGSAPFRRLARFVVRRRGLIIVAWILALVAVVPFLGAVGNVTSLQRGSAAGNQLESVVAGNTISAQFQKTVPNSTLLIVITTRNASSLPTQRSVMQIVSAVKSDPAIKGLMKSVDVYSTLYPILTGLNEATYTTLASANSTDKLLLGVPALYLGIWQQAFVSTQSVASADNIAYQQAAARLSTDNATAYRLYGSHVLSLFNSSWAKSWVGSGSDVPLITRASAAASVSNLAYVEAHMPSSRAFGEALVKSITLQEFLSDSPAQSSARLSEFAVRFVSNSSALSPALVKATYAMGKTYANSTLQSLTGNVIWSPRSYGLSGQLASLVASLVSPSRDTTLVSLGFDRSSNANLLAVRSIVRSALANQAANSGIEQAQVTGGDAITYDFGNSTQGDLGLILPVTIGLLIVATGLFFRSALTPFITLGTIGVALGISQVFILIVGTYVAKVDFTIPTILLTILIGVGTDYSVFVIARYREERVKGSSVQEAVQTSVTWAGESIATSGATVIISFLSLTLTSIVYLRTMGFVVGLGVLVALSVALTLVPAVVTFTGGRTFWPISGGRFARYASSVKSRLEAKSGYFSRSGAFAVRNARALILLALVVSIPTVYIYATTTPTYDFLSGAPPNLESISASNHLTSSFGGGKLLPTYVVVTFSQPLVKSNSFNSSEMGVLSAISAYLSGNPDIQNATGPTNPFGRPVSYSALNLTSSPRSATLDGVLQAIGKDNETALITANFRVNPYSTAAISDASAIRSYLHQNFGNSPGVSRVLVGGASGSILDTKNVFDSQFASVLPIVAIGVALVLLVVLGSLFLPLFAVVSVLASIIWTLAVTKLVFQTFYNYQILFITPLFLFVTLLGLGMDYNIFILTRIREEATKGRGLNDAIIRAIEQTGGIITAAAIILAGSLGALMLSNDLLLKQLGFAFSFSILIDALFVRTYLVPAVMSSMKKWNWYNPVRFLNRSRSLYESEKS